MSLQDIIFKRAAIQFQNDLGSSVELGKGLTSIANTAAAVIQKQRDQRDAEKKSEADFNKAITRADKAIPEDFDRKISIGPKGGITITGEPKKVIKGTGLSALRTKVTSGGGSIHNEDGSLKTETELFQASTEIGKVSATLKQQNADSATRRAKASEARVDVQEVREARQKIKDKLNALKGFGGMMTPAELEQISSEADVDLGTDLQSGRIEKTGDGNFRVLSTEEFGKKADIIKDSKDAESGLNIVLKDIDQVSRMFDMIKPRDKGPLQGRALGPVAGAFGSLEVGVFNDVVKAFVGNIARSVLLERGVLTDKDIERAKGLLPKLSDTDDQKAKKIDEIKSMLKTRFDEFSTRQEQGLRDASVTKVNIGGGSSPVPQVNDDNELNGILFGN